MKKIITIPVAILAMTGVAGAGQINWFIEATSATYADGSAVPTGGLTFQLGSFGSFAPTADNFADWSVNFNTTGLLNPTGSWTNLGNASNPTFGVGSGETVIRPEGPSGTQGYIWGYTSLDTGTNPEWILLTNSNWTLPAGTPEGSIALATDWKSTDAGTQLVFGGAFNHPDNADLANALNRTLQTQAIPEPSTYALIFGLGALGFLGFRRLRK